MTRGQTGWVYASKRFAILNLLQHEHSTEDLAAALDTSRSAVSGQTQHPRRRQDRAIAEKLEEFP